jgi:hypothetical protein
MAEALTKEQYLSGNIDYGSQYYGLYDLGTWTGVDVDPVDTGTASDNGRDDTRPDVFDKNLAGDPMYSMTFGVPSSYTSGYSYQKPKDRVDFNFSGKSVFATAIGALGGIPGKIMGSFITGDTVTNAFGHASMRPSGPLGFVADKVHEIQYDDMNKIAAAIGSGSSLTGFAIDFGTGGITRAPGSLTYTGNMRGLSQEDAIRLEALSKGFVPRSYSMSKETGQTFKQAGWMAIGYDTQGDGVTAGLPSGFYTSSGNFYNPATGQTSYYGSTKHANALANASGLTRAQIDAALQKARTGAMTLEEAIKEQQQSYEGYDVSAGDGDTTPPGGDFSGIASTKPGMNYDYYNTYDDDDTSTPSTPDTPSEPSRPSTPPGIGPGPATPSAPDWGDNNNDNSNDNSNDGPGGGTSDGAGNADGSVGDGYGGGDARGGMITHGRPQNRNAYAFGTPPAGVQASQSGFIDAPPSQVTDGAKVADDRPMKAKEGTYIINAAAVEYAGEKDIRKMIMDAQKEAVRRGLSTEDFERHSNLIDIAVSSGEVTIAPHLVKIIGEDRLEKINKRGIRKTEQRIAQNGQQPVQAARGGFLA